MVVCCHGGTLGCHMWAATHTLQLITFPCSLGHLKVLCWGVGLCVHLGENHKQPSLCALQWLHASVACVSSRPKQLLEVSVLAALPSCDTPCTSGHPQALPCTSTAPHIPPTAPNPYTPHPLCTWHMSSRTPSVLVHPKLGSTKLPLGLEQGLMMPNTVWGHTWWFH